MTTTERDPAHGGYEAAERRSEPKEPPMTKTQNELLAAIISDEEIIRVHGHANFGSMSPREVVNDGVWKSAVGYHCGHTQFSILRDHGLITKPKGMSYDVNLTKKGKRYARLILAALRSPDPEVERLRGALERIASGLPGVRAVHRLTEAQSLARAALSSNSGGR